MQEWYNWNDWVEQRVTEIQRRVGDRKAVVAVSGGVDSTVTAVLAHRALKPEQVKFFTIDDGLRREGEPEWVVKIFAGQGICTEVVCLRSTRAVFPHYNDFFWLLDEMVDGVERRTRYSQAFGDVCGEVARGFEAQYAFFGTNALDLKETSHGGQQQHNAWALMGIDTVKEFNFEAVEPIETLLKAEIRELAAHLGLPSEIVNKMPFPGPGLAIRVMDAVTLENIQLVREATAIVEEHLSTLKPFQCLAFLMGGRATTRRQKGEFGHIVSVRCLDSADSGQTATPTEIPPDIRQKLMDELLALPWVARVVFDPTPKPPGRIEYM